MCVYPKSADRSQLTRLDELYLIGFYETAEFSTQGQRPYLRLFQEEGCHIDGVSTEPPVLVLENLQYIRENMDYGATEFSV